MNTQGWQYTGIEFTAPMLALMKKEYDKQKLALVRASEVVEKLDLELLIRMADSVNVGQYSFSLTMSFQECQRRWLIPALTATGHPWDEDSFWEISQWSLWEEDQFGDIRQINQETVAHVLTLQRSYLRETKPNGRKKRPIQSVQVRIHQKSPGWINNVLTLPDGCECRKELNAYVDDTVTTCRVPQ